MKKTLFISATTIMIILISIFACKKDLNKSKDSYLNNIYNYSLRQTAYEDSVIIATLEANDEYLKSNLDLLARGIVYLVSDTEVVSIVANYMKQERKYRITLSSLISLCNNNNIDLVTLMLNSLDSTGATQSEINRLDSIIESFDIDNGISFKPEIVFPALDTVVAFDVSHSNWDVQTPCMVATSLFYMNETEVPIYRISNGYSKSSMAKEELLSKPVWHISLSPNFERSLGRDGVIEADTNGNFIGFRPILVSKMNQIETCNCIANAVGSEEGEVIIICESNQASGCSPVDRKVLPVYVFLQ